MRSIEHMLKLTLFAVSLLVAGVACRREVDYELAYAGDRLVINGVITPQRTVTVSVSRSNAPSGEAPRDLSVSNATVLLYENSVLVERLVHRQQGQYFSPSGFKPGPGKEYFLEVTAPGLPPAKTASVSVPHEPVLQKFSWRSGLKSLYNPSKPATELDITLQDSAQTVDYYQVEIATIYENKAIPPTSWVVGATEEAGQPCTRFDNGSFIYRDNCFNGTTYRSIVGVETSGTELLFNGEYGEVDYQKLRVRVQRISESYYRYLETSDLNEGIGLAFFEPTFLYSNVEGGFGIWAAANEKEIIISI